MVIAALVPAMSPAAIAPAATAPALIAMPPNFFSDAPAFFNPPRNLESRKVSSAKTPPIDLDAIYLFFFAHASRVVLSLASATSGLTFFFFACGMKSSNLAFLFLILTPPDTAMICCNDATRASARISFVFHASMYWVHCSGCDWFQSLSDIPSSIFAKAISS
jgi:hypothetical protein